MNQTEIYRQGIENEQYPDSLCKYTKLNKHLENSLREHYLWYESLENYNDPYDGRYRLKNPTTKDYECFLYKQGLFLPPNEINKTFEHFVEELTKTIEEVKTKSRVCCFSALQDNILMWSHYAENHTGVCLVFDYMKDVNSFSMVLPITYTNTYREYNYVDDNTGTIHQILATKSLDWAYEKEYRSIKEPNIEDETELNNKVPFIPSALTEIIFGCKVDPIKKKNIIDLVKALPEYNHVKFRQAELHPYMYKLIIK